MLGVIGGVVLGFSVASMATGSSLDDIGYAVYWTPVIILIADVLLGLILTRTVGMAALGVQVGGAVGFVIALFSGAQYAPAFLLMALAGWLLQHAMARGLEAQGRPV